MKKRVLDVLLASALFVPALPVMGMLALAVRYTIGRPIILRQERVGKDGVPFVMYKFRGMTDASGTDGKLLPAAQRLTPIGRFMRNIGIDEIPQLWNILKGDMSFVGPRPRLYNDGGEEEKIPDKYREILQVRPGLTGVTQVVRMYRGRELPMEEKLRLDWNYAVNPPGLLKEIWLIAQTAPVFIIGNSAGTPVNTRLNGISHRPR